jgi:rRNA-processing protein FCF1
MFILAVGKEKIGMKIVLDTNFLVSLIKFKLGLEEIYNLAGPSEIYTIEAVVKELERIASSGSKDSRNAKVALELIKRDIKVLKSGKNADDALLALDKNVTIATNDAELRKKLKGRRTIYLRARKRLVLE